MGMVRKLSGWLPVVGALAVLGGVVFLSMGGPRLLGGGAEKGRPQAAEPAPVPVTVAPVTARAVQRSVRLVGAFHGNEEVTVGPRVEGRVVHVLHDVGD